MKLYIRNMVDDKCRMMVIDELQKLGIKYTSVELGEINLLETISTLQRILLNAALLKSGYKLTDNPKDELIGKLKRAIADLENHTDVDLETGFQDDIILRIQHDFLSTLTPVAKKEDVTTEKYSIDQKFEKIKKLLSYVDLTLSEIAYKKKQDTSSKLYGQLHEITGLSHSHSRLLNISGMNNPQLN